MKMEESQNLHACNDLKESDVLEPAEVRLLKYHVADATMQAKIDNDSKNIARITDCQKCDGQTTADNGNQQLKSCKSVSTQPVVLNWRISTCLLSPWKADGIPDRSNLMKSFRR